MKSIKTKMMVFVSLSILMLAIGLTGFAYFAFKNLMLTELETAIELMAEESAELVGKLIESNIQPLVAFTETETFRLNSLEEQVESLKTFPLSFYEGLAVVNLEGLAFYTDDTSLDLSDRPYIHKALAGDMNYSDLIMSRKLFTPVIMGAFPIFDVNDDISGAVIARVKLCEIAKLIGNRGYGDNGYAYMVDGLGYFVYHEDDQFTSDMVNALDLSEKKDGLEELGQFIALSKQQLTGVEQYTVNNQKMWMGYSKVEHSNWNIYVGAFEEDVFMGLYTLRRSFMLLTFLMAGLTMPLTFALTRRLTGPILTLDDAFIKATHGDLNVRVAIKTGDEIERAGQNFNQMMSYINTLTYDDSITKLPNLTVFSNEINHQKHAAKADHYFTVMLISADGFDALYEKLGYDDGNRLLRDIAEMLKAELPQNAQIYKGRAEDFLVYFNDHLPYKQVLYIAQQTLKKLNASRSIGSKKFSIDFSIGIDFIHTSKLMAIEPLLTPVTHARNLSKEKGSNQITVYNESTYKKKLEITTLEEDLIDAIDHAAFHMVFQPLYDLKTVELSSAEALIRWEHPQRGMISPDVFIPLAEKLHFIDRIDYWVIDQVMGYLKSLETPCIMSINVCAQSFERDDFVTYVSERMKHYQIEKNTIQIELTERDLVVDIESAIQKLMALRNLGVLIAIDDFGVGYSSLNYILQLPIDCIKIDRSFVLDIFENRNAQIIVSTIIAMSKSLNLKIVAEGIETKEMAEQLLAMGCEIGQGYYFKKPLSKEAFKTQRSVANLRD